MEIYEGVICHGLTLLDLHNSSDDTQPHPTINTVNDIMMEIPCIN